MTWNMDGYGVSCDDKWTTFKLDYLYITENTLSYVIKLAQAPLSCQMAFAYRPHASHMIHDCMYTSVPNMRHAP